MKTRSVNKYLYGNYLKKADELIETARGAHSKNNWNAVVINSIHSVISASDSLLVFFKEIRSSGESHEDVISLLRTLAFDKDEINNKARQLQRLIQIKNAAEYEEKLMSQQDAENSLRDAERFIDWVKTKLGES